ncbi:unnamed protein product [Timema podura]|uniref:Nucleoporin Nup54 alpha-helical domain-containing protein n=1 Tax=Timema podura TaxID=61482 RepID=A0ABN7NRD1_TIMPD|nr:unnamed protein product [Timema podura]
MSFGLGGSSGFQPTSTTQSFGFGSTAAPKAGFGTTGFGFGGAPSSTPSFNLGGGTTSTTSSGLGFGGLSSTTATSSGFGSGFGGFGSTGTTNTTGAMGFGGFGGFGTATSTTPSAGFGFGSTLGTQPSTGTSLFSGFGQPSAANTSTGFGGFGGFGAKPATGGFGGFGTGLTTGIGGSTFGTGFGGFGGFGAKPATGGFGGFGTGLTTGIGGSTFGTAFGQQQQQQQPQPQQINPYEALHNAVFNCNVYGDERDSTLTRWNLLQALWGTGKGYYSQNAPPIEFNQHNPLCRFKAIGYNCMPTSENKDGLVAIVFNQKESDIKSNEANLINSLNAILGSKPNLTVTVESIKSTTETKTQSHVPGPGRRIPATELAAYLHRMLCQQPSSITAENVLAQIKPDKDQLAEYLEQPPAAHRNFIGPFLTGIDPRLWKQAQEDNPDRDRYVPVPIIGFGEVCWRLRCQENETRLHQAFLDKVSDDITELQRRLATTKSKTAEYRRKFVELEHRLLKLLVKQEVSRNLGMALTPEEEALRSKLETLYSKINAPTQFKGRLSELLSQIRMVKQEVAQKEVEKYTMDETVQDEYLAMEQNGMAQLINIIQADMADLTTIKNGMMRMLQGN